MALNALGYSCAAACADRTPISHSNIAAGKQQPFPAHDVPSLAPVRASRAYLRQCPPKNHCEPCEPEHLRESLYLGIIKKTLMHL